jgi:hypothetical protein
MDDTLSPLNPQQSSNPQQGIGCLPFIIGLVGGIAGAFSFAVLSQVRKHGGRIGAFASGLNDALCFGLVGGLIGWVAGFIFGFKLAVYNRKRHPDSRSD